MAELFQKHAHPPRMRTHFDHHMGRWASKEEGPKRLANRLDGLRSFHSAVRPKNAQSALLVSQIASNHRSGTFRHGRSLLAPSSALKPADYLLGLKERPPHPISVGRAACVAQNPHGPRVRKSGAAATTRPASPRVIRWHRQGFRAFWTWKSRRGAVGRAPVISGLAELVRTMALANPLWGSPRIHGELLK